MVNKEDDDGGEGDDESKQERRVEQLQRGPTAPTSGRFEATFGFLFQKSSLNYLDFM